MRRLVLAAVVLAAATRWAATRWVAVTITGDSMVPAFADGDRVLVRRMPARRLRAGDVVVAWLPGLPRTREVGARDRPWLVKRVAALPGDRVPAAVAAAVHGGEHVPADQLVLLGDNAEGSVDSRDFGYVAADLVLGRVVRRLA